MLGAGVQSGPCAAEGQELVIYGVAQRVNDALSGVPACVAAEAAYPLPGTLDDAVTSMAPCAVGLSQRYGLDVRAAKGALGTSDGQGETMGILLQVPARLPKGSRVLLDLSYAIRERRHGMLLGRPAAVWSGRLDGGWQTPAPGAAGVPTWMDGPSLRLEVRLTKVDIRGDIHAVLFDKEDNELELALSAGPEQGGRIMAVFVKSSDEELGPWPVESIEAGSPGALGRMASAVAIPAELDAGLRRRVQGLFGELRELATAQVRP